LSGDSEYEIKTHVEPESKDDINACKERSFNPQLHLNRLRDGYRKESASKPNQL
jgi:hypothetical protein